MTDRNSKNRDAFDVSTEVFEGAWCSCCPSRCTMPVATVIAAVLGILVGWGLYELDVSEDFVECYKSPTGSKSTAYSIATCAAPVSGKCAEEGCTLVATACIKIDSATTRKPPAQWSCWYEIFEYPGKLWLNALKCLVAPLIASMMLLIPSKLKALGPVGQKVAMLLLFTSFIAAMEGLIWGNIIQPGDAVNAKTEDHFKGNDPMNNYVSELESFLNIGFKAVPSNIFAALSSLAVLGIITFFLTFGYYLEYDCPAEWRNPILNASRGFLRACLNALMLIMWLMPIAMFSLLSFNMMKTDLEYVANAVALYLTAQIVGQFVHLCGFYFLFYFIMTARNPLKFYMAIWNAPFTAFLTSSSAATLPVTLKENKLERGDNYFAKQVVEFVCPLGAAINMDGTSLGFPVMVLFVAQVGKEIGGYGQDDLSFGNQLLVAILAMVCSLGTAPIPNAGMVYLTMLLEAADITDPGLQGMGIAMILLVDWIVDRIETAQNVGSDSFISAIIAYSPYFDTMRENIKNASIALESDSMAQETQMSDLATPEKGDQRV